MTGQRRCEWPKGTGEALRRHLGRSVTGQETCGRPAKFHKARGVYGVQFVCGIHEQTLRLRGWGGAERLGVTS
jgi:hypothetical protein